CLSVIQRTEDATALSPNENVIACVGHHGEAVAALWSSGRDPKIVRAGLGRDVWFTPCLLCRRISIYECRATKHRQHRKSTNRNVRAEDEKAKNGRSGRRLIHV